MGARIECFACRDDERDGPGNDVGGSDPDQPRQGRQGQCPFAPQADPLEARQGTEPGGRRMAADGLVWDHARSLPRQATTVLIPRSLRSAMNWERVVYSGIARGRKRMAQQVDWYYHRKG